VAQFNQPNYDRARKIEAAICPAGSRNLPVNQLRSAILSSLGGTNIDGRYICNAYAPLKRAITAEDVQEMRDLVSNIACLPPGLENIPPASKICWKPSIHMFRRDSRILLEITDVRVERLQDITYEQAAAEGVHRGPLREWCASDEGGNCHKYPVPAFRDLWQSVGGNWDANPWVWVVEFKRVTP